MGRKLYSTVFGNYYCGDCVKEIERLKLDGKVQLLITSPPFPLNKKKRYGNLTGDSYLNWVSSLAPIFSRLLTPDGSIVIELGNSWEPGRPVQSLLHIKSLLSFLENPNANLRLCQEFVCYNPSRLPSPAQWVTINRIRATDSFTHVWWMSKTDYPKADNRRILRPYSAHMNQLLSSGYYNSGRRPSEHVISKTSFLTDNHGSISHNVLELEQIDTRREFRQPFSMLSISNSKSNDYFMRKCRERNIIPHPARMPLELVSFFIEFLTDPGDLVLDPFAGSNTTGFCAERLKRRWIGIDADSQYGVQSSIRFEPKDIDAHLKKTRYLRELEHIINGKRDNATR